MVSNDGTIVINVNSDVEEPPSPILRSAIFSQTGAIERD